MFLLPEPFHATHESFLFGLVFVVTDYAILVFFPYLVVTCGCVGSVAITVLLRDRRRQHKLGGTVVAL